MRIAITIKFLLFPIILLAQPQTGIKEKEISLTLFASPDYSFGYIPRGVGIGSSTLMRYEDKGILAYTFGVSLRYNFKPRLSVSLGFNQSRKGYNTYYYYRNLDDFAFTEIVIRELRFKYLEVPLKLQYEYVVKGVKLFANAGISYWIPKLSVEKFHISGRTYTGSYTEMERSSVAGIIGFGSEFQLKEKIFLLLNPELRRNRDANYASPGRVLTSVGLNTGITLKF
jgi:hypothetical protein